MKPLRERRVDAARVRLLFGFALALLLAGCKVGPDYHRPAPLAATRAVPAAFDVPGPSNTVPWKAAEPAAHLPRGAWWELFHEPELSRLMALANQANQDLAAALARLDQARALVGVARSDLFPQLDAAPAYTRQRTSFNQPQAGHAAGYSATYNTFTLPLQAGWELDLWGRVRRQLESARARLAASADDVESLKLALQAEVATDYFALRALEDEYDLVVRAVEAYRRSLTLTVNRRQGGIASDLDVSQAQTQLRTTEAQLPVLELRRRRLLHALAALCGRPATGFDLARAPLPPGVPEVPVYVPAELLERRPDIAAAERRMVAQNAQVGVAQGAFYPRVRLNGAAGLQSVDAATLFDWPSRFWAVGPALDLPLFTGGRNRAQLAAARAAYDEAVAQYRQTVLGAFQEVEDQLAGRALLENEFQAEQSALESARRTLEIAMNRYQAGLVTYLEVAIAQTAALERERALTQLRGEKLATTVALVRALGGGWSSPER